MTIFWSIGTEDQNFKAVIWYFTRFTAIFKYMYHSKLTHLLINGRARRTPLRGVGPARLVTFITKSSLTIYIKCFECSFTRLSVPKQRHLVQKKIFSNLTPSGEPTVIVPLQCFHCSGFSESSPHFGSCRYQGKKHKPSL